MWAYPIVNKTDIQLLESSLFHKFDSQSQLMNGKVPAFINPNYVLPNPASVTQVISNADLVERLEPEVRLPRQAQHYANLVDHFLVVKRSEQIARSMQAHFERLNKYHLSLLSA